MASDLVLAHASGFAWDEALLVLAPLVVVAVILWMANRRAARLGDTTGAEPEAPQRPGPPG